MLSIEATGSACGATVAGVDLSRPLSEDVVRELRRAWMRYHVLVFPEQKLTDVDLVRVTGCFGPVGEDPFFEAISDTNPVVALTRRADEKAPVFAENWHSDWSFKAVPPIGTCLYALTIPPVGGNTDFVNQHLAYAAMPDTLKDRLADKVAVHSAALAYAPDGTYGDQACEDDRSIKIRWSESARDQQTHPLVVTHPENGQPGVFSTAGYIVGIEGMGDAAAQALLAEVREWQTREEFVYSHQWQEGMLVIWDNRSVLHRANGGYDGYDRELHRTTIAEDRDRFVSPEDLAA